VPAPSLLQHVDLVVSSLERSLPFYRGLMEQLGGLAESEVEGERGETIHYLSVTGRPNAVGLREKQSDDHPAPYDRYAIGVHHVALSAASREAVDRVAAWLGEIGAPIEGAPREYDYSPGYYAVFFHDPDWLKLEVLHRPPRDEDAA
jgi:catechol 2,3-dioxygenase-like lactoylglutathione lyase family enzyme